MRVLDTFCILKDLQGERERLDGYWKGMKVEEGKVQRGNLKGILKVSER